MNEANELAELRVQLEQRDAALLGHRVGAFWVETRPFEKVVRLGLRIYQLERTADPVPMPPDWLPGLRRAGALRYFSTTKLKTVLSTPALLTIFAASFGETVVQVLHGIERGAWVAKFGDGTTRDRDAVKWILERAGQPLRTTLELVR